MTSTYQKPTPLFAQHKEAINQPEISTRETPLTRCSLEPRSFYIKTPGHTRVVEICEIIATTSKYQLSINGRKFEPFERTEFLLYSEEGIVIITLDHELLLPIANWKMSVDPWLFTVRAQCRDGPMFMDDKYLFSLPSFTSRKPSAEHFQRLLDPSIESQLNVIQIFTNVLLSHFWNEPADPEFEVTYGHDGQPFTASGGSNYLCEITR
ncbi:MAG: hypothetical protein ACSHX4_10560 [Opitutaceae bacterium]